MSSPAYGGWGAGEGGYGGGGAAPPSPVGPPSTTATPGATIIYRQLGPNNDPQFGQGVGNFLADRFAVAQAVLTRLRLLEGEWWEALSEGTPVWQKILTVGGTGAQTRQQQISLILQKRILDTPYVLSVSNIQVSFNTSTRAFQFYAAVQTQFGPLTITNAPTVLPQGLP